MTPLQALHTEQDQSPWLDNLRRDWITNGELQRWVDRGIRGVTSNPSIFQKAIEGRADYDEQFASLIAAGTPLEDIYWDLVVKDIEDALAILAPVYEESDGIDGFVSVEVAPDLAHDTAGTIAAARGLHERINKPNLFVKIPGTAEGVPAIQQMISEGRSINVTLLFSLERYGQVIEAYMAGLEACPGDLSRVASVSSFFVSRVDNEVDAALNEEGTVDALRLRGKVAVANAQLAYELFERRFRGPRWEALVERGARVQRPLWASTSTKNPNYQDTLYVDPLIAPNTVNTMPEATLEAFDDHGVVARTADANYTAAHVVIDDLERAGVDLDTVTARLEMEGVAAFSKAFNDLMSSLQTKADQLNSSAS